MTTLILLLQKMSGDHEGVYYPLTGMSKEVQQQLIDDHFLFKVLYILVDKILKLFVRKGTDSSKLRTRVATGLQVRCRCENTFEFISSHS